MFIRQRVGLVVLFLPVCVLGIPCPDSPGLRVSESVRHACEDRLEVSTDECRAILEQLESMEAPSPQQRFDLVSARMNLTLFEPDATREKTSDEQSLKDLQGLHEELPEDVQVMRKLALLEDDETRLNLQREIAVLAPNCTSNIFYLASDLDWMTGYGWSRSKQDPDLLQELKSILDLGYETTSLRWYKMFFGQLRYREYLLDNEDSKASQFRQQVIEELSPATFPFENDENSDGWTLLCGEMGYKLRFAQMCLNALDRAYKQAISDGSVIPQDVYYGAGILAAVLVDVASEVLDASPPPEHAVLYAPYSASEGARILIGLRDLLESVPEDQRTTHFYTAYEFTVGQERRAELQEKYYEPAQANPIDN